jgi:hypothetical protein
MPFLRSFPYRLRACVALDDVMPHRVLWQGTKAVTKYTQAMYYDSENSSKNAGLVIPVLLVKEAMRLCLGQRSETAATKLAVIAPVYLAAVIEYLLAELLELAGNVLFLFSFLSAYPAPAPCPVPFALTLCLLTCV